MLLVYIDIIILLVVQDSIVTASTAQVDVQLAKSCLTLHRHRDQAVSLASTAAALAGLHSPTSVSHCRGTGIRQSALLPLQQHFRLSHAVQGSILTSGDALIEGYSPSLVSHCRGTGIRQSALLPLQQHFRLSHAVQGGILTSSNALAAAAVNDQNTACVCHTSSALWLFNLVAHPVSTVMLQLASLLSTLDNCAQSVSTVMLQLASLLSTLDNVQPQKGNPLSLNS